ncbi:MAG TPA: sulfatase-like hydrolase/transferase [Thermoanaerobaculia bacterium]|nr:sulfatase-like hydrolase/transferase [Thermoanaerobaculia bacterium]
MAILLILAACNRETVVPDKPQPPKRATQPPIFLISVDTLRADRVGGELTPNINAFARDAITFEQAYSHVPQTLPSHTTILTGLLPQNSGVRDNIGYALSTDPDTLPAILKENGYTTGAAVSTYVLRRATGIDRGFDQYDDELEYASSIDVNAERGGQRTLAALERWLDGVQSRKVFGFLHLYEPHAPYDAPAEYASKHAPYDAEVAYADAIVGRFLESLRRRNLYDDALIVFLSDHGEGLGDHGEDEHGVFVYREAIHVPLIVKLPRRERAGERVSSLAALTDVMPTILAGAGLDAPARIDGVNLLTAAPRDRRIYAESYLPRLHMHWHELTSLVDARFQFIDAPKRELYDWNADAAEKSNVADAERRTLFAMADALKPLVRMPQPPAPISAEDQQKLAALGYIGSASSGEGGDYPDAKDRIQYVRMFRDAEALVKASKYAKAIPLLVTLTKENPALVDEWSLLATAYQRSGKQADAITTLREANKRFAGSAVVALPLADLLAQAGQFADARAHAELAQKDDPVFAQETLAKIAFLEGDLATARRHIDVARSLAPRRATTLVALSQILKASSDWQALATTLDESLRDLESRHLPPIRGLHDDLGEALLHLQRGPEAEQAFRKETELFPNNIHAWGNYAIVLAVQGRIDEAKRALNEAVQRNPSAAAQRMRSEVLATIDH